MSSKRWLNTVALITLIHVGVIGFLWQQDLIQPPRWVDTQIVASSSSPESQSVATMTEAINKAAANPVTSPAEKITKAQALANDTAPTQRSTPAAIARTDDGIKPASSSMPKSQSVNVTPENPAAARPNTNTNANAAALNNATDRVMASGSSNMATSRASANKASADAAKSEGDLTEPTHIGGHLRNPRPPYPEFSRDAGEQGVVTLSVMVEPSGRASSVDVVKSSGYSRLDRSAHDTVLNQYRFVPATRGGQPIPYHYRFSIVFNLNKAS